ncbi:MAG: peptidylprolyl isomerase [Bacteroidetes bacterium]|nr:peptidylprolyl isomerase [Bacteroidota bacterium]
MAMIENIRNRQGLLMVFLGLGMLSFLVPFDAVLALMGQGTSTEVGSVNGDGITGTEYQVAVQQRRGLGFSGDQLPNEVWEDMTTALFMSDEYADIGMTVSDKEYQEMLFGDLVSPYVSSAFYSNGDNKRTWVQNFQSMLSTQEGKANFLRYKEVIVTKRKKEKFEALAQAGAYSNALEDYLSSERKAEFQYVVKLFTTISDSVVKVSDRDVQVYFNDHKDEKKFQQIEGRDVTIVKIPVGASSGDVDNITAELQGIATAWDLAEDAVEFATTNSSGAEVVRTIRLADVETDVNESTFFDVEIGTIVGPYQKGNLLTVANILGRSMVPDTAASVRHILLQAKDVKDAQEMVALNSKADSLVRLLKNGADFTDLTTRFSDDPGSKSNGGVYEFFPQNRMVKPFNDFSFDKPIGSIGSVETSYGVHVIEVLDRRKKVEEVEVAKITRQIGASDKTKRDAYSESNEFAIESSDRATLESAAKEAGYTVSEARDVRRNSTSVSGMTNATELVNWAYNAEEGEISQPILIDNNYVVAILNSSREKGTPDFDAVEEKMRAGALKKAKGEHYALLMTGGDLDEVAAAAGATVKTALNVNIKTSVIAGSGASAEPEVAGLAFSIPVGEMSNPIIGNHGVWVIAPSKVTEAADKTDFLTEQSALVTQVRNGFSLSIRNAIRDGSDVVDDRN